MTVMRTFSAGSFAVDMMDDLEVMPVEFLVDGLIETRTLGVAFGDPGCGKSFLAIDVALCVSTGTNFHGRKVRQGPVIYIAGEDWQGLVRRKAAWLQHHGREQAGPIFLSRKGTSFLDKEAAEDVAKTVKQLAEARGEPALIVVDTLARNFGDGDENSTADMNKFVAAMDDLRANWPDCVLLVVHHTGHGDKSRGRGSMALKGGADFEYRVQRDGDEMSISCVKMKNAEEPRDISFDLKNVFVKSGVKSAVLHEKRANPVNALKRLSQSQRLGLETLNLAIAEYGRDIGDSLRGVHLDEWREFFYRKHTGDSAEAKKKAFQRVRNNLTSVGVVGVDGDIYTVKKTDQLNPSGQAGQKRDISRLVPGQTGHTPLGVSRCPDVDAPNADVPKNVPSGSV